MLSLLLMPVPLTADPDPLSPDGMVLVPAGEVVMGSNDGSADEGPAHRVHVSVFYIDRLEVTNEQFARFVRESGGYDKIEGPWFRYYAPGCRDLIAHYESRYGGPRERTEETASAGDAARWGAAVAALRAMEKGDRSRHPVRGVTWRDAVAYAGWTGKRLPTEAEWEKAARGPRGWRYPWGSTWDPTRCRAALEPGAGPVAVGSFPDGASPSGCLDMAGNVWEWVADWYGEDYYGSGTELSDPTGPAGLPDGRLPAPSEDVDLLRSTEQGRESDTRKVIRGGGWSGTPAQASFNTRSARRFWSNPSYWHPDVGFRCVKDVK